MKMIFWLLVISGGIVGLAAIQYKHKIKSNSLRSVMISLGGLSLFALAGEKLYTLSGAFTEWGNLTTVNVLVPLGWFLAACFVLFVVLPHQK